MATYTVNSHLQFQTTKQREPAQSRTIQSPSWVTSQRPSQSRLLASSHRRPQRLSAGGATTNFVGSLAPNLPQALKGGTTTRPKLPRAPRLAQKKIIRGQAKEKGQEVLIGRPAGVSWPWLCILIQSDFLPPSSHQLFFLLQVCAHLLSSSRCSTAESGSRASFTRQFRPRRELPRPLRLTLCDRHTNAARNRFWTLPPRTTKRGLASLPIMAAVRRSTVAAILVSFVTLCAASTDAASSSSGSGSGSVGSSQPTVTTATVPTPVPIVTPAFSANAHTTPKSEPTGPITTAPIFLPYYDDSAWSDLRGSILSSVCQLLRELYLSARRR